MREIKFRAWNKKYNEMVTVDGLTPTDGGYNVLFGIGECIKNGDYILMQYTGIKDKNGKEIYEGDILRVGRGKSTRLWVIRDFLADTYHLQRIMREEGDESEVIGNIYENPELLSNN